MYNGEFAKDAAMKEHERNYESLTVYPDGDLVWNEKINKESYSPDSYSLITVGTGSVPCNCDWCHDNIMHKETGACDSKDGWIASYSDEELSERGFNSAEAAYEADRKSGNLIKLYPEDYDFDSDALGYKQEEMIAAVEEIPLGFFDDEN